MKPVDFRTSFYFPGIVLFVGAILLFVGLLMLFVKPIAGIILTALSLLILTTHYRVRVDFDQRTFFEYLWIAGFKSGEKEKYEAIDHLYITKSRVSQTMHSRASSSTFRKDVYNGFIRFSEDQKLLLFDDENKDPLKEKLMEISKKLNVEIVDHS